MNDDGYSIDHVLHETHHIIEELKTQLNTESNRLSQLEANLHPHPTVNYHVNNDDYVVPAWFNE